MDPSSPREYKVSLFGKWILIKCTYSLCCSDLDVSSAHLCSIFFLYVEGLLIVWEGLALVCKSFSSQQNEISFD